MSKQKKMGPRKVIESTAHPDVEHQFIKYSNATLDITDYKKSKSDKGIADNSKAYDIITKNQLRPFTHIHTHPHQQFQYWGKGIVGTIERLIHDTAKTESEGIEKITGLPSGGDLIRFLYHNYMKTMVIAVRNTKTGKVLGYQILRKTKNTPIYSPTHQDWEKAPVSSFLKVIRYNMGIGLTPLKLAIETDAYDVKRIKGLKENNLKISRDALEKFAEKYHFQIKMIPSENYKVNEERTYFAKKKSLEYKVGAIIILIGISAGVFFLSANITGNVIVSIVTPTTNVIGRLLLVIGLIGGLFLIRKDSFINN